MSTDHLTPGATGANKDPNGNQQIDPRVNTTSPSQGGDVFLRVGEQTGIPETREPQPESPKKTGSKAAKIFVGVTATALAVGTVAGAWYVAVSAQNEDGRPGGGMFGDRKGPQGPDACDESAMPHDIAFYEGSQYTYVAGGFDQAQDIEQYLEGSSNYPTLIKGETKAMPNDPDRWAAVSFLPDAEALRNVSEGTGGFALALKDTDTGDIYLVPLDNKLLVLAENGRMTMHVVVTERTFQAVVLSTFFNIPKGVNSTRVDRVYSGGQDANAVSLGNAGNKTAPTCVVDFAAFTEEQIFKTTGQGSSPYGERTGLGGTALAMLGQYKDAAGRTIRFGGVFSPRLG